MRDASHYLLVTAAYDLGNMLGKRLIAFRAVLYMCVAGLSLLGAAALAPPFELVREAGARNNFLPVWLEFRYLLQDSPTYYKPSSTLYTPYKRATLYNIADISKQINNG